MKGLHLVPYLDLAETLKVLPELHIADHGRNACHKNAGRARRWAPPSRQGILCLQDCICLESCLLGTCAANSDCGHASWNAVPSSYILMCLS